MKIIKPSWEIIDEPNWDDTMIQLERAMRTCYKSEDKITTGSAEKLIHNIIDRGHESTLEHVSFGVRFVCDRGVSHELVRHRHCSFSQESTRYVKYDGEMEFILPCWMNEKFLNGVWDFETYRHYNVDGGLSGLTDQELRWVYSCLVSEESYKRLIDGGWSPQQARSVLPNSLKTEIVMTTNLRDWRHIFHLRCDKSAHPQLRELMIPLYDYLSIQCPVIFDTVKFNR